MPKRPWWNIPQRGSSPKFQGKAVKTPRKDVHIKAPSASGGGNASVQ